MRALKRDRIVPGKIPSPFYQMPGTNFKSLPVKSVNLVITYASSASCFGFLYVLLTLEARPPNFNPPPLFTPFIRVYPYKWGWVHFLKSQNSPTPFIRVYPFSRGSTVRSKYNFHSLPLECVQTE